MCVCVFQDKQNEIIQSITELNKKFDELKSHNVPELASSQTFKDNDDPDPSWILIKKMASSKPEVRDKVNYRQCLEVLGFPASSLEDVS